MQQALNDTNTLLKAFVIQKDIARVVPHSTFHSLEATHMRTVLSQLNDNTWYKTFNSLDTHEHKTLDRLLNSWANGKTRTRELLVLKVLQQNSPDAWMGLSSALLRRPPFRQVEGGRAILAICREKQVDGNIYRNLRYPQVSPRLGLTPRISVSPTTEALSLHGTNSGEKGHDNPARQNFHVSGVVLTLVGSQRSASHPVSSSSGPSGPSIRYEGVTPSSHISKQPYPHRRQHITHRERSQRGLDIVLRVHSPGLSIAHP